MAYLDDFPLREIFLRLPVKSLHRFKCVSKHWLSFISDIRFGHEYVQFRSRPTNDDLYKNLCRTTFIYRAMRCRTPRRLDFPHFPSDAFDEYEGFSFEFIPRKFQERTRWFKLIVASHGWILCSTDTPLPISMVIGRPIRDYHLCNPLLKQWIDIPRPPKPLDEDYHPREYRSVGFIWDEDLITSCSIALRPPQFKVVETFNYIDVLIVLVFSSENWEWRKSTITCKPSSYLWTTIFWGCRNPHMVSCDGTLYWNERGMRCLFALDLDSDGNPLQWHHIPLPTASVFNPIDDAQLELCRGQIHLSCWDKVRDRVDPKTRISTWKLIREVHPDDDYDRHYQWSLKNGITIHHSQFSFGYVRMVHCAPSNEDILYVMMSTNQTGVFNLRNNTLMTKIQMTSIEYDDTIWNRVLFVLPYWPFPLKSSPKNIPTLEEKNR